MDEPQSSQDGVHTSKFTYRHLNALSSSTPPKENPLRYAMFSGRVLMEMRCVD